MVQAYDAASHPEVLAGARTREAAKREFLETFEVDGDRASLQNFREYYANVSAAVDDDALFATLVRNAWSLNAEKQSPRGVRALVTHRDGRQSVEVLSEDGEDALESLLRSRGVDADRRQAQRQEHADVPVDARARARPCPFLSPSGYALVESSFVAWVLCRRT